MRAINTTMMAVWSLAVVSILVTLVILIVPFGFDSSIANRAQIGATVSTTLTLILSIIAIIVTAKVESSDYKAEEDVKSATAQLLACLRSIAVKGTLHRMQGSKGKPQLDLKQEKIVLNGFLSSTTAFAYWTWEEYQSQVKSDNPEWRLFFFYLIDILDSDDSQLSKKIQQAVILQRLLTSLTVRDMKQISKYVSNLSKAVGQFSSGKDDVLIKAINEVFGKLPMKRDRENFIKQLIYLKKKGIQDPNIDLFLAVANNSPQQVQAAISAGADPNIRDIQLLAKYSDQLGEEKVKVDDKSQEEQKMNEFLSKMKYLKGLGIKDPDIDLWIAVIENNPQQLKMALDAEADPNVTDSQLLIRYQDQLKDLSGKK